MKKSNLLIMPLMVISLLASCGGNKPGPTPETDVKFSADTMVTLDKSNTTASVTLDWTPTDHAVECSNFAFTLNNQSDITSTIKQEPIGSRPLNLTITFDKPLGSDDKGDLMFHYNDKTAKKEGEGKITGINVELFPWYFDTTYLNSLTKADVTAGGGEIQTIKINGLDHKVRLIGVDEDKDANEETIHTTWEFVDLLSDENGFSLATYWNDVATEPKSNYNYKDSTIRACLNGTFSDPSQGSTKPINWFQYFGENEDIAITGKNRHFAATYAGKSVLDMFPSSLVSVLKAPSKYININNGSSWEEETINDKLFLLSPKETGHKDTTQYEEPSTTVYSYYNDADNNHRVKHQINWDEGARTNELEGNDLDGEYKDNKKFSWAGFDAESLEEGDRLLLRSPSTDCDHKMWFIGIGGTHGTAVSCANAMAIAPAFCI